MRLLPIALILGTAASATWADEGYRPARIRELEGGVALQRASESAAEDATPNLPFLPGDRVWTDGGGRVEFQFDDGALLRLDSRSKLDYLSHDERDDRVVLRLWSGSAWLVTRDGRENYEIETSNALVVPRERGTYRIDADSEETRLSVFDGEASFESGRRSVDVQSGERSWAERGSWPEEPRRFDRSDSDDFQAWNEDRDDDRSAWAASTPSYVPDEVRPYAGELERSGSWYFVADVGHVWRPYVASGWRPYSSGRWVWTYYGWTWVPTESWGWAVSHYGRWDYGSGVGWYWIPGTMWGPGWVSWAVGGDYVGWCPLGRRDRPVILGNAVPRGSLATHAGTSAWVYTRRSDLGAPETARRRVELKPELARELRVADTPHARPSRDARTIEVGTAVQREAGIPRNVRTKLTPGDTVPEIAVDNRTTIPAPIVRHPRPRDDDDRNDRRQTRDTPSSATRRDATNAERGEAPEASAPTRSWSRREGTSSTRPSWSRERDQSHDAPTAPRSREVERRDPGHYDGRSEDDRRAAPRGRDTDSDRDVLRRMFRPLSERPAPEGRSASPRSEPRSEPRVEPRSAPRSVPRSEPRREPAASSSSSSSRHAAPRPSKDKDNR